MNRQAFTLIEIITVIVIIGVIGALAIPGFGKMTKKAAKNEVIAYLRNTRSAEKMYYGKSRTYLALADSAAVKSQLGIESRLPTGYSVAVSATSQTFSVVATSPDGTIAVNESGVWSGTDPLKPQGTD